MMDVSVMVEVEVEVLVEVLVEVPVLVEVMVEVMVPVEVPLKDGSGAGARGEAQLGRESEVQPGHGGAGNLGVSPPPSQVAGDTETHRETAAGSGASDGGMVCFWQCVEPSL
jgi:hypothetical protein